MKRVAVIGSGGAGKSSFARRLGDVTGIPVVHLDREYWRPGWLEPPRDEWVATVQRLAASKRWIMDGNYGGTIEIRLARADTIVFLDLGRTTCLWRVLKRRVRYRNRARPEMAQGCEERLTWQFVRWIWEYPSVRRPGILAQMRQARADGKRVHRLRSQAAVERFLAEAATTADAPPRTR